MTKDKNIPSHIAIIMDGNGRWAKARHLPKIAGHRAGVEAARRVLEAAKKLGIQMLTLYTFSTENWTRPRREVEGLFSLLEHYLDTEVESLHRNGIRFNVIGVIGELPGRLRLKIEEAMARTKGNAGFTLTLAINYGSRREITEAARSIAREVSAGGISPDGIDEATMAAHLFTRGLPDPELLIRTSGEMRISNFLLWQLSYAELWFTRKYWPDFSAADLKRAVADFQKRQRRFGG